MHIWRYVFWSIPLWVAIPLFIGLIKWETDGFGSAIKGVLLGLMLFPVLIVILGFFHINEMTGWFSWM